MSNTSTLSNEKAKTGSRWVIVLAGGEGRRLRSLIRDWLGETRPKQYCTFMGTRSMLQHTLDRARKLVKDEHIVTVVGSGHRSFLKRSLSAPLPGTLVEQPIDRGTAAGIYLAASHIFERDPLATILVMPSDSYISPEERFQQYAEHAMLMAEKYDDQLFQLGVTPKGPETDFGWIESARSKRRIASTRLPGEALTVSMFYEKPNTSKANALYEKGCLWNTGIFAAKVKTLWWFGWCSIPDMMRRFETFSQVYPAAQQINSSRVHEAIVLTHLYHGMSYADFMRDVLAKVSEWSAVIRMDNVEWSDWGRPERIKQTIENCGANSSFLEFYDRTQAANWVAI